MRAPRSGIEAKKPKKNHLAAQTQGLREVPSAVRRAIRVRAKNDGF
jgi:hypothetical protein